MCIVGIEVLWRDSYQVGTVRATKRKLSQEELCVLFRLPDLKLQLVICACHIQIATGVDDLRSKYLC